MFTCLQYAVYLDSVGKYTNKTKQDCGEISHLRVYYLTGATSVEFVDRDRKY